MALPALQIQTLITAAGLWSDAPAIECDHSLLGLRLLLHRHEWSHESFIAALIPPSQSFALAGRSKPLCIHYDPHHYKYCVGKVKLHVPLEILKQNISRCLIRQLALVKFTSGARVSWPSQLPGGIQPESPGTWQALARLPC